MEADGLTTARHASKLIAESLVVWVKGLTVGECLLDPQVGLVIDSLLLFTASAEITHWH